MLLTWLSAITNPSLLYLYHPTSNAFSSASLIVIMALIFCTEHILSFIHYIIQQMMSAIPSSADNYIKEQEYRAKKRLLEKRAPSLKRQISSQEKKGAWNWGDHSSDLEESLRSAIHDYKTE
jgi:hypothetical protein